MLFWSSFPGMRSDAGMNLLLVGINAKFSHTALGVYSIGAYLSRKNVPNTVVEYTINDPYETVFYDIIRRKPDVIGFSSYLWNIELIKRLMTDIKLALPTVKIFLGGPEAGYAGEQKYPLADCVISGEGEAAVYEYLTGEPSQDEFPGLPFAYQAPFTEGKTVYYEASRGLSTIGLGMLQQSTLIIRNFLPFDSSESADAVRSS